MVIKRKLEMVIKRELMGRWDEMVGRCSSKGSWCVVIMVIKRELWGGGHQN